jgi:DNA-binding winged helix-turn-helix (wHTH) protein
MGLKSQPGANLIKSDSKGMKEQLNHFYIFGAFRINVAERILFGERGVVPLTPKAFDTLLVLVENSGHVLGKDELMEKVWPDSFVEENNLAQHILALRKALGETGGQKFIETISKRGYRFVAKVRESLAGAEGMPKTGPNNKMQTGYNERQHKKDKPFLGDVVIIGRAIDFK